MRNETSSLAFGTGGRWGSAGEGGVVAFLHAASAACRGSCVRRVLSAIISHPCALCVAADQVSKTRKALERAAGIEPATYSLGSCRSTTELRPRDEELA